MARIYLGDVIEDIQFPATRFEAVQIADPGKADRVLLVAHCTAPDTGDPECQFTVTRGREVEGYYPDEMSALHVVADLLHYIACHEVDEKLTFRSGTPLHPHSEFRSSARP